MTDSDAASQADMFSESEESQSIDPTRTGRRSLSLTSERALERLRDRIHLAARELHRLREENARLHRQVEELQTKGLGEVDGTPVVFTEDAGALRNKVERFIESIDLYLANQPAEATNGSGSATP